MDRTETGKLGEDLAVSYLKKSGYAVLHRNWRFSRSEIDIIAEQDGVIVIIEVKTRLNDDFVEPSATVSESQMRRLADAFAHYADQFDHHGECRFDVIGVSLGDGLQPRIKHYEDAFWPG